MVVTVSFDYANNPGKYELLQKVFAFTLAEHGNEAMHIRKDPPEDTYRVRRFQTSNNYKLGVWIDTLKEVGKDCCFCDVDMLCLGNIAEIWEQDFDIAYTKRSQGANVPLNAGVMFIRNTPRAIRFLDKWRKIDDKMRIDPRLRGAYAERYCGQNQASFGFMLEKHPDFCKIIQVPCRKWNVCDEDWPDYPDDAKFVHVKSRLRDAVFSRAPIDYWSPKLQKPLIAWYNAERRMIDKYEKMP